jgi:hypothetical protein
MSTRLSTTLGSTPSPRRDRGLALALAATIALVTLTACSDDGASPQDEDDPDQVVIAGTVGAAGDTLITNEFDLMVPAGAFSEEHALVVLRHDAAREPDTRTYELTGVPVDFADSLQFRLGVIASTPAKADGPDVRLIPRVIAELAWIVSDDDTMRADLVLDAQIDADGLTATLPARDYFPLPEKADPSDFLLHVILSGSIEYETVLVQLPVHIEVMADESLSYARDQLTSWLQQGVALYAPLTDDLRQIRRPSLGPTIETIRGRVSVTGEPTRAKCFTQRANALDWPPTGDLELRAIVRLEDSGPTDVEAARIPILEEFWNTVYFERTSVGHIWWGLATGKMLANVLMPTYEPTFFDGTQANPLIGFGRIESLRFYGDAMAPLAAWIDTRDEPGFGRDAIAASIAARAEDPDPGPAFLDEAIPGTPDQWWPAFASDLVSGNVPFRTTAFMLDHVDDDWVIDAADDLSQQWTEPHFVLDGSLYRIYLERDDFHPDAVLDFVLTDHALADLSIFTVTGDQATPIWHGNEVTIAGLDQYAAAGTDLLALVTFAGTDISAAGTELTLDVILDEPDPGAEVFTMTKARTQISWFRYATDAGDPQCTDTRSSDRTYFGVGWFSDGQWDGTTFVGHRAGEIFEGSLDGHHEFEIDIAITVSGDGQHVTAVDYSYWFHDFNDDHAVDEPDEWEEHRITFSGELDNITPFAYDMDFKGEGVTQLAGAVYTVTHWTEDDPCEYQTVVFELLEDCEMYVSFQDDVE